MAQITEIVPGKQGLFFSEGLFLAQYNFKMIGSKYYSMYESSLGLFHKGFICDFKSALQLFKALFSPSKKLTQLSIIWITHGQTDRHTHKCP